MSEFQLHVQPATRAVDGKFDPKVLEGRTILGSDWAIATEVVIEGEELPKGVTAKVTSVGATAGLSRDDKSPINTYEEMFLVTATNEAGEPVPFAKKGDGGKIVTTRDGHVVGVIAGGGPGAEGVERTVLVPAEQFKVGMPA